MLMCKFHYDYIKAKYGNKSRLLSADTDGLMHEIKTEDMYEKFSNGKEMFCFSNYSAKSKYYENSNKLVPSKMKNDTAGAGIEEFVRLKLKMHSYLVDDVEQVVLIFCLIRTGHGY